MFPLRLLLSQQTIKPLSQTVAASHTLITYLSPVSCLYTYSDVGFLHRINQTNQTNQIFNRTKPNEYIAIIKSQMYNNARFVQYFRTLEERCKDLLETSLSYSRTISIAKPINILNSFARIFLPRMCRRIV